MAKSAARAGWAVYAADLFCDLDLQSVAREAVPAATGDSDDAAGYPWSLRVAAARFPPSAPWCYSGALENYPALVDAIAATRPLAGNAGNVLRRLRDPAELAAAVVSVGLEFPETVFSPLGVPEDGTFLVKPLASAGGRGIRRWTRAVACDLSDREAAAARLHVWQRWTPGIALSAAYCLSQGKSRLLGLSRQLIGEPWCHAGGFAWCGAVAFAGTSAPPHHDRLVARLEPLGDMLADRFQAVGLVGVDLIVDAEGRITVIEVNPRPTASMELFERMTAGSIAASHLAACGCALPSDGSHEQPLHQPGSTWAKAVLFAAQPTPVSQPLIDALGRESTAWMQADGGWPALADIPRPGQSLAVGAPGVSIFAVGHSEDDAVAGLRARVARVDALFAVRR
jgi:predicted ATP-grasp superfamily ATP-dependent carboligase